MRTFPALAPLLLLAPMMAAAQEPEIQRPVGTAQAVGAAHTVRQIPEACVRIEGRFTGRAEAPYDMQLVRTSAQCQPRAEVLDHARVQADANAWTLNDRIRIPAANCPQQQAVVEVWRKQVQQPLDRDGQGQVRVYLDQMRQQAAAGHLAERPAYAIRMEVQGKACR